MPGNKEERCANNRKWVVFNTRTGRVRHGPELNIWKLSTLKKDGEPLGKNARRRQGTPDCGWGPANPLPRGHRRQPQQPSSGKDLPTNTSESHSTYDPKLQDEQAAMGVLKHRKDYSSPNLSGKRGLSGEDLGSTPCMNISRLGDTQRSSLPPKQAY